MITLTTNQIKLSQKLFQKISSKISQFEKRLPHINLLQINILVKKSATLYHPRKHYHASFGGYIEKKSAKAAYLATIAFILPSKKLSAKVTGQTVDECLKKGLETIEKQIQKYKTTHFKSQSRYPDHTSIRKATV